MTFAPPVQHRAIFGAAAQSTTPPHSSTTSSHSSTTTHTTSTSSSQTTPPTPTTGAFTFFPEPSTLHPPPDPEEADRNLAKNIVGYVVLAFVLIVILFILLRRFYHLRRDNQPLSNFFRIRRSSPPRSGPSSIYARSGSSLILPAQSYSRPRLRPNYDVDENTSYENPSVFDDVRYPITAAQHLSPDLRYIPLSYFPFGYHAGTRRTRAADVDEQGRRLDSGRDPDQHSLDGKDVLPAYDRYGGPPKYVDLEMALDGAMLIDRLRATAEANDRDELHRAAAPAVESEEVLERGQDVPERVTAEANSPMERP